MYLQHKSEQRPLSTHMKNMKCSHGSRESLILCFGANNAERADAYRYLVLIRLSLTDTLFEHVLLVSEVIVKVSSAITPIDGKLSRWKIYKIVPKTVLAFQGFTAKELKNCLS